MARNKLYRNFIILQEDEKYKKSSLNEKALSGYAKIEAKGDKCKITFYAQNLKKDDNYAIVLICNKKDMKQIIDMGSIVINNVGKGEACIEYFSDDIGGLSLSYDKISGAAVCKKSGEKLDFLMYGFINGEKYQEGWKNFKVLNCDDKGKNIKQKEYIKKPDDKKDNWHKEDYKEKHDKDDCYNMIHKDKDDCKKKDHEEKYDKDDCKKKDHEEKYDKDDCKKKDHEEKYDKDDCKKKDHGEKYDKDDCKKKDHEEKHDECDCKKMDYKDKHDMDKCHKKEQDSKCKCIDREPILEKFENYERNIEQNLDPYDFKLRGGIGDFFENLVKGFEEVKGEFKGLPYCKWFKVPIRDIEDMCVINDYNKYSIIYYPMLNYYPYISKHGYFMMGYKCDSKGNLKYLVYAIPGKKDKGEQPYGGKSGFVTWCKKKDEDIGFWLMFYDYKNSTIVVPSK